MLLIISTFGNETLKVFSQQLKTCYDFEVKIISIEDIVNKSSFVLHNTDHSMLKTVELPNNKEKINFNDAKLVYLSEYPYVIMDWMNFQEELDKSYAFQEWTATITAMLNTCENTKFINPILTKYDLNTEIEQLKIFQQFDIGTVEMILTNNKDKFMEFYEQSNNNVIFKTVRQGYESCNLVGPEDLASLDKLQLSPVIFQKIVNSNEIEVCLVGKQILAKEKIFTGEEITFQDIILPEELQHKLISVSEYLGAPLLNFLFVYDPEDESFKGFSLNIYHNFTYSYQMFKDKFLNALKSLLSEEYFK